MGSVGLHLTVTVNHAGRQLRATGERSGSAVLLRISGSVDASNVAVWQELLSQATQATCAPGAVIVDISPLEFLGCCGFVALAEESALCRRRGIRVCVVDARGITARAIAACRLQDDLPLYPRVDAALNDEQYLRSTITAEAGDAMPV